MRVESSEYSLLLARDSESKTLVYRLREGIYKDASKIGSESDYQSSFDERGDLFIIERNGNAIGTFSVYRYGLDEKAGHHLMQLGDDAAQTLGREQLGMYVYFLGIDRSERTAAALKFVFGEIFKILVRSKLETIFILADRRLAKRYKLIGFQATGVYLNGLFTKSGRLALMSTRQTRLGVYGLHADPVRWNIYLRSAIVELRNEGLLPTTGLSNLVFRFYSLFSGLANQVQKLISIILATHQPAKKSLSQNGEFVHVR